jgi:hypothetical protein
VPPFLHGGFNFVTASPASTGTVAMVMGIGVTIAAVLVVVVYKPKNLARYERQQYQTITIRKEETTMTKGNFTRWLYRGQQPHWIAKFLNKIEAAIASSGLTSNLMETLEVTGRKSGRTLSLPVVLAQDMVDN